MTQAAKRNRRRRFRSARRSAKKTQKAAAASSQPERLRFPRISSAAVITAISIAATTVPTLRLPRSFSCLPILCLPHRYRWTLAGERLSSSLPSSISIYPTCQRNASTKRYRAAPISARIRRHSSKRPPVRGGLCFYVSITVDLQNAHGQDPQNPAEDRPAEKRKHTSTSLF